MHTIHFHEHVPEAWIWWTCTQTQRGSLSHIPASYTSVPFSNIWKRLLFNFYPRHNIITVNILGWIQRSCVAHSGDGVHWVWSFPCFNCSHRNAPSSTPKGPSESVGDPEMGWAASEGHFLVLSLCKCNYSKIQPILGRQSHWLQFYLHPRNEHNPYLIEKQQHWQLSRLCTFPASDTISN